MLIPPEEKTFFTARDGAKLIFSIRRDGSIEFGEGVTPDEASRQFYDYVCSFIKAHGLTGTPEAGAE